MAEIGIVANQVTEFFLLMSVGFAAAKGGILTREILEGLMKLIVKILLPCLILKVVAGSGTTVADYTENAGFAVAILACYALLFVVGTGAGKLLCRKGPTYNVFVAEFTFGDMGFIGIPLLTAVLGGTGTSVAVSVYTVIDMALLWTLGVYLCSRHNKGASDKPNVWKNMISPTSAALLAGVALVCCAVRLPDVLMGPIASIGSMSSPLALIYIGGMLSFMPVKSLLRKKSILGIVGIKMVVLPLIVFAVSGSFFDMRERMMLMYMVGLPAMTTISMLAQLYSSDQEYATTTVFLTTLASVGTLPLITWLSGLILA
jgi:Predicted permeases